MAILVITDMDKPIFHGVTKYNALILAEQCADSARALVKFYQDELGKEPPKVKDAAQERG